LKTFEKKIKEQENLKLTELDGEEDGEEDIA